MSDFNIGYILGVLSGFALGLCVWAWCMLFWGKNE